VANVSWPALPTWLGSLQVELGEVLRQPLDRSQGQLSASPNHYPPALVMATKPSQALAAAERLAVYNRQYWLRLFTVLHHAYPLVARLLGYWELNRLASDYLGAHPPQSWDLDEIVPGWQPFIAAQAQGSVLVVSHPPRSLPALAVREAVAIDAAHHRIFRAPRVRAFQPTAHDGAALLRTQLCFVPAAALLTESWPLCELRREALSLAGEDLVTLGGRLPKPRTWLLMRQELSMGLFALEHREAELLALLQRHPVAEALGVLEAQCSPAEREALPTQTRAWLARSVRLGVWAQPDRAQK
jgi:Putative DNA-binding domain